ncbi:LysR substrate-binding domain-containing protein [Rothia sp. LK2588]|uniref:LysR substrate-binding domain-containing protein n=1 Tax=Rothia sp. LK2588 TaxID=3114369 RepID=UPI0034CFE81F
MTTPENAGEHRDDNPEMLDVYRDLLLTPERADYLGFECSGPRLRVGYVPGVMPGKWFSRWHERYDHMCPLFEAPLTEAGGLTSLQGRQGYAPLADMVLLRPDQELASRDKDAFHLIELYREKMVVVLPRDHTLSLYEDEVPLAELAEEFMLQDPKTVPEWAHVSVAYRQAHPQKLPMMRHTQDAIELVAAGLGLLLVPMSVARFYHRKDLTYRIVPELSESPVALVWPRAAREDAEEQIIQDFIGICRGRTPGSDRGSPTQAAVAEQKAREKAAAKQARRARNARAQAASRAGRKSSGRPGAASGKGKGSASRAGRKPGRKR